MPPKEFLVTFKKSPKGKPCTWTRYGFTLQNATESAKNALREEYGDKAVLVSVEDIDSFLYVADLVGQVFAQDKEMGIGEMRCVSRS